MRIGLDLDGVVADWHSSAVSLLNTYKGHNLSTEDPPSWDYIEREVGRVDWRWLWSEGITLGLFSAIRPYPGELSQAVKLANLGDIIVITARPKPAWFDTLRWLSVYEIGPPKEVIFTSTEEKEEGRFPECDIYVDDKPENVIAMAKTGETWMRTRRYNEAVNYGNRVNGLSEFVEKVKAKIARSRG
jgi:5'(3')-deoxyribonucleotidase